MFTKPSNCVCDLCTHVDSVLSVLEDKRIQSIEAFILGHVPIVPHFRRFYTDHMKKFDLPVVGLPMFSTVNAHE